MQSRELPCGRVLLAAATLLSLAAPTARAQVREGVPTSITMALAGGLAALNAVAHPPMSCAGRDADSLARPRFERLIAAARAAGFRLRVTEAYRTPKRQA